MITRSGYLYNKYFLGQECAFQKSNPKYDGIQVNRGFVGYYLCENSPYYNKFLLRQNVMVADGYIDFIHIVRAIVLIFVLFYLLIKILKSNPKTLDTK